ncbi:MAG: hypothetical protein RML15_05775 [Bacteroidota bacterium]|nr:hypothetical protein [Bacteroidota bacterium]
MHNYSCCRSVGHLCLVIALTVGMLSAQPASPAHWLYPQGASIALPVQPVRSAPQPLNAFMQKWQSRAIAGDVRLIAANIVPNTVFGRGYPYAPLELATVLGSKLVLLDAGGKTIRSTQLPPLVTGISAVVDSTQLPVWLLQPTPSLLLLETAESSFARDSFATAYIAGYDPRADSVALVTRLTYDLRPYTPNLAAWARPVFAQLTGTTFTVYSVLGTTAPTLDSSRSSVQFLRGMAVTQVPVALLGGTYPIPDAGDNVANRMTVVPHVGWIQPSIYSLSPSLSLCVLPSMAARENVTINSPTGSTTSGGSTYLFCTQFASGTLSERFVAIPLDPMLSPGGTRPVIIPSLVELYDGGTLRRFILVAESYRGRDGSFGRAQLHLFNEDGTPVTTPTNPQNPPFRGGHNHGWALAVADVDGNPSNEFQPFYPNNPGAELILTQSSRELAVAGSRLMVLRYHSGTPVPKPSPAGSVLFPLDTIVTYPITGWLAAVADLDSASDGKAEILLADGSDLLVLRLRDYKDPRFRTGAPFDTVVAWHAPGEEITNVIVADLEGDAKLDIIVTTTGGTYALGTVPPRVLHVTAPADTTGSILSFCAGDTIRLRWRYPYSGTHRFTIAFVPGAGQQRVLIKDTLLAAADTFQVLIPAMRIRGETGHFIVWLSADSTVRDQSGIFTVSPGTVSFVLSSPSPLRATAGTRIILNGTIDCIDTLLFVGSFDRGQSWQPLSAQSVISSPTFLAHVDVPCTLFPPLGGKDTLLLIRAIGRRGQELVYSDTIALSIEPQFVPLEISQSMPGFCCTYVMRLSAATVQCSSAIVLVQFAAGQPWTVVDSAAYDSVIVRGRSGSHDTLRLRWACRGGCIRTDTIIVQQTPRLITAVAPNPVHRGQQTCRILTTPRNTAAVTIRIFDTSDRVVRTLVQNELRTADHMYCDVWDCRSDSGELVPPGVYYVLARSSDGWESFEAVYVR